jgi:hypothetical protein
VRASGLQGDMPVDIIEIIDDGHDAFGDRVPTTTIYDSGGPRWVGPVAAVVLIGLIGWGVATSASNGDVPKVAPSPSTIAPPPTTAAPTTTIAEPLVPFYAADPPRELTVEFAQRQDPPESYYGASSYQLWAEPGATAESQSWFSIESYDGSGPGIYAMNSHRIQAGEMSIAISRDPGGITVAQFSPEGRDAVAVTSFGLSDDEIVQLAQGVSVVRNVVQVSDAALVDGYELISTLQPWAVVQGIPVETLSYSSGNNPLGGFNINVSQRHPTEEGGSNEDREAALRFLLTNSQPFGVNGNIAIAGDVIGFDDYSLATWTAGDHIVTVTGSMPVQQLVSIAQTVHEISPQEWSGLEFQAAGHSGDNNFGNYDQTDPVAVSFGTDSNGEGWTVEVATATFGDQQQIVWQWGTAGIGTETNGSARITTVVDSTRTYVLAELPRAVAATAHLQVGGDGLDSVLVPFADPDPELDRTVAAYAFSEPTTFTAQIIGVDGTVLATWPES